jgi:hypothetical protein
VADNVNIPATGTGDTTPIIAADDIGGVKHQRVKVEWGVDGSAVDASASNPLPVAAVVTSSTLPTGASSETTNLASATALGTPTDAAATTTGSVIAQLRRIANTLAGSIGVTGTFWQATQPVSAAALPLPSGASTETTLGTASTTLTAQSTLYGGVTETAPASDTASSGLNGRLQRIAQRLSSLIALVPTALGAHGGFVVEGVASGTPIPVSGSFAGTTDVTASGSITASAQSVTASSLNGLATATLQITGTFVGIMDIQGTVDGSTWFFLTSSLDLTTGVPSTGSQISSPCKIAVPVAGLSGFRVLSEGGWTSGTAVISMRVSAASEYVALIQALPFGTSQIGGVTLFDGSGSTRKAFVDTTNRLTVSASGVSITPALTQVAGSATSVTIIAANASRKASVIVNDSTATLYVAFAATCSAAAYTYKIAAGGTLELPVAGVAIYTGLISGIWSSATGNAVVTDMS